MLKLNIRYSTSYLIRPDFQIYTRSFVQDFFKIIPILTTCAVIREVAITSHFVVLCDIYIYSWVIVKIGVVCLKSIINLVFDIKI